MITLEDVRWTWEGGVTALDGVNLRIGPGERVLITGASGSGKSTLLQLLAGLLPAHGRGTLQGRIEVAGTDPAGWSPHERARQVGYVQQEPHHQLVASTVGEEVAFAAVQTGQVAPPLELGLPAQTPTAELSGGQCQRVAAAAARSAGAPLLLLDEPLAHLDPMGVQALLEHVGGTVVLVEHRLEPALAWADRLVVLEHGRIVWDGPVALEGLRGLALPASSRVEQAGGLDALGPRAPRVAERAAGFEVQTPELERNGVRLWPARTWTIAPGDRIAIVGPNGAGKSTALGALARALGRQAVWIPQQPELSLFAPTVEAEVRYGPEERGLEEVPDLEPFGLDGLGERHPLALSKGQQLRVAVAAGVAARPRVLLLDEPTAGQHLEAVDQVFRALDEALGDGALIFATHDLELALRWSTWVVVVGGPEGPAHQALRAMPLPPLQAAQAERGWPLVDVERQLNGPPAQAGTPFQPGSIEAPAIPRPERPPLRPSHLVLLATVGTLAVLLDRPLALGGLALFGLGFLLTRRVPVRPVLLVLAGVVWSTVLSQGLFYGDRPRVALLARGPIVLWREGVLWGGVQSLRLVAVSTVGLGIALGTSTQGLAGLLERVRVPRTLAFLTSLAVQAVPSVGRSWWTARTARARRGRAIWRRSPWAMVRTEVAMLVPVVHRAVRQGRVLARSLDARGFSLDRRLDTQGLASGDRVAMAAGLALIAVVAGLQLIEAAYRWEIFYDPALRPLYAWVRQWL